MNLKYPKRLIIGEMILSGILYSMFIIIRFAFKEVNLINGFSPQIHLIILVLGVFSLQTIPFRILFVFLSPFFTIIFGISGNIFFDYMLPCWSFAFFICWYNIFSLIIEKYENDNKKIYWFLNILIILVLHIISYTILVFSYTLSGIIFYQASFIASFVLNAPIGYITMGISIFVVSACTYPLYLLKGKISKKIYW